MEGRGKCRAECAKSEERGMRRLREEEKTGDERKKGLEEMIRSLRCRVC